MKHQFTTGKRLTHPTWSYKTRMNYLKAKEHQTLKALSAIYKVFQGSAWLPKKIRTKLDVAQNALEDTFNELSDFNNRLKKRNKKQ